MKLFAVADLHLGHPANREALPDLPAHPEDWLILAGDVGETERRLEEAFDALQPKYRQLVWVPGNHELWSVASEGTPLHGVARYERFVDLCRARGILTPEDDYPVATFDGVAVRVVPMFLLYDYSFRPADIALEDALAWARRGGVVAADERLLSPAPYTSRAAWCHARVEMTLARLEALDDGLPTVLVNHWPLRHELARPPAIPRFSLWCGTELTEDWHRRFDARVVISGHLHMPSRRTIDRTRFEEVSLGYPKQWLGRRQPFDAVRRIVLEPAEAAIPQTADTGIRPLAGSRS